MHLSLCSYLKSHWSKRDGRKVKFTGSWYRYNTGVVKIQSESPAATGFDPCVAILKFFFFIDLYQGKGVATAIYKSRQDNDFMVAYRLIAAYRLLNELTTGTIRHPSTNI